MVTCHRGRGQAGHQSFTAARRRHVRLDARGRPPLQVYSVTSNATPRWTGMMASASARLLDRSARGGIVLVLLILVVAGAVLSPEFTTAANLRNIINQAAPLALLALGQTFVIAA